jgi:hypothetical protein
LIAQVLLDANVHVFQTKSSPSYEDSGRVATDWNPQMDSQEMTSFLFPARQCIKLHSPSPEANDWTYLQNRQAGHGV